MTVGQLPEQVLEFARYLNGLVGRLDRSGGWYEIFWQRDPAGMRACLEGREVPPWDVVEALLQDVFAQYGERAAAQETVRARALHGASLAAYDVRPGGRDALGDRLDVMLREQRYAAERRAELGGLLPSAATREEAEAIRLDLAWAEDDHERATARCAELRHRMDNVDRHAPRIRAQGAPGFPPPAAGPGFGPAPDTGPAPGFGPASGGGSAPGFGPASGGGPAPGFGPAPGGGSASGGSAPGFGPAPGGGPAPGFGPGPGSRPAAAGQTGSRASAAGPFPGGHAEPGARPTGLAPGTGGDPGSPPANRTPDRHAEPRSRPVHTPAQDARPASPPTDHTSGGGRAHDRAAAPAPTHDRTPPGAGQDPAKRSKRRRRGGARFAGMAEPDVVPVAVPQTGPVLPAPSAQGRRTPRGARFAGAAEEPALPHAAAEPESPDEQARQLTADTVATLTRLRSEGRSGEAHVLLAEAAYWPPARFPLLAAELHRAGLDADWATLLWEAASLPVDRVVSVADVLAAAGRSTDARRMLRQGVTRPAPEIGAVVLDLAEEGRGREITALLDAYVRVRSPEEAARSAEADPERLVPLLLRAAQGVSDTCQWDLVHALHVAGFTA
ncbi:hypothetical protein ACH4S8_27365 [Streptomyces sp. NPDC021080]|uniref:hypothetical protein n=1 Tax=Streptomyces sp. NPDC021080 TaxID=3365110 RepID=UPI003794B542